MRGSLVTALAVLVIKTAYDGFVAPIVPDRELFGFMPVQVGTGPSGEPIVVNRISVSADDAVFAALCGLGLGTVEGLTRKVTPG